MHFVYVFHDYEDSARNLLYFINEMASINDVKVTIYFPVEVKWFSIDSVPASWEIVRSPLSIDLQCYFDFINNHQILEDVFCFINSSCIGPIVPAYANNNWIFNIRDLFSSSDLGILAPVVEIPPDSIVSNYISGHKDGVNIPFAHSYCFFISKNALISLRDELKFFKESIAIMTKDIAVSFFERLITALIINCKYEVRCLMKKYKDINFSDPQTWDSKKFITGNVTCPEVIGNYYGSDLNPYEVLFYKNIRHPGMNRGASLSGIPSFNSIYIDEILYGN